ncbi:MAG: flagellar basal body-associated FliL family protein [Roseovarius sp.]|nr:flagellar basal body-associated FliL family protein [Roseovarius sp.]
MKRLLMPAGLLLLGLGAGIGAGIMLAPPAPEEGAAAPGQSALGKDDAADGQGDAPGNARTEFVRLNNQFVVPIVARERVTAMVILSLSIEVRQGASEDVFAREPKLRDAFLQVMFDHANRGGFDGAFTDSNSMDVLRRMLLEEARTLLGTDVHSVLITEIARQDV